MTAKIVMPSRMYGTEIECFNHKLSREAIANLFAETLPTLANSWQVGSDGTVCPISLEEVKQPQFHPLEIRSPKLSGPNGLLEIQEVCEFLQKIGCKVNKSCGLHVHVNAIDLNLATLANMIFNYVNKEEEIDTWMSPFRRGNANGFCKSPYYFTKIIENNPSIWKGHDPDNSAMDNVLRYYRTNKDCKLNIGAFVGHRSVEFRQHDATLDFNLINTWILFCLDFVENSKVVKVATNEVSSKLPPEWKPLISPESFTIKRTPWNSAVFSD